MKIFKLAWIDMKLGGILKKRYLVLVLLCGFYCNIFKVFANNLSSIYGIQEVNLGDLIAYVHCGTIPGIRMIQQREFQISYMWLSLLMLQLLLPLDYPVNAMENWGYPYVMKSSRKQWWIAKCIYTVWVSFVGILLENAVFVLYSFLNKFAVSIQCHSQVVEIIFGSADGGFTGTLSSGQYVLILILLPALGMITMSLVLLLLSINFGRPVAYILGVVWIIASVFVANPLLPGNCTMAIRSVWIDTGGVDPTVQIIFCAFIIAATILTGNAMIRCKDFFRMIIDD